MTRSSSKIVFKPLPQDDPRRRRPDISRAREVLGWEPRIPLDAGLKKTIAYFSGVLGKSRVPQSKTAPKSGSCIAAA